MNKLGIRKILYFIAISVVVLVLNIPLIKNENTRKIKMAREEFNAITTSAASLMAGEDLSVGVMKVEQRFTNTYISTATTTTLKTGAGLLHTIVVNGGTAGTIIVYDNTAASGTIIASFDSTNALATYTFDCTFATGLTIITSAATKLSVNWR